MAGGPGGPIPYLPAKRSELVFCIAQWEVNEDGTFSPCLILPTPMGNPQRWKRSKIKDYEGEIPKYKDFKEALKHAQELANDLNKRIFEFVDAYCELTPERSEEKYNVPD